MATLAAAKNSTEAWTRCGMKLRVLMAHQAKGAETSVILGTDEGKKVAKAHLRPGLQPDRLDARPDCVHRLDLLAAFAPGQAKVGGRHHRHGHAVVDQRAGYPVDHIDRSARRQQRAAH
jgi:hypothetical protein